jgi:2-polyprenyl-6-methoxyphenol hydroxylase-like FAD-dependent oxidoreductase
MMPQWEFPRFLVGEANKLPALHAADAGQRHRLVHDADGRVAGVRGTSPEGASRSGADCTSAATAGISTVRAAAGLAVEDVARADRRALVSRRPRSEQRRLGPGARRPRATSSSPSTAAILAVRLRHSQGRRRGVAEAGLAVFPSRCRHCAVLWAHIGDVRSWSDVKLLTVAVDRLLDWSEPGLLCIGDAAHAMSPVGRYVGINRAIQDAVAAANLLGRQAARQRCALPRTTSTRCAAGRSGRPRRRQAMQVAIQNNVARAGHGHRRPTRRWKCRCRLRRADPRCRRCSACFARLRGMACGPSTCARRWHRAECVLAIRPLVPADQAMLWEWLRVSLWDPPPAPLRTR